MCECLPPLTKDEKRTVLLEWLVWALDWCRENRAPEFGAMNFVRAKLADLK